MSDNGVNMGYRIGFVIVFMFVLVVLASHYATPTYSRPVSGVTFPKKITCNGYDIEVFDVAEDQLRYARSGFSDSRKKQAALQVLIEQYPRAVTVRAEAELELAYLALGDDYRFADESACRRAIIKYGQIVAQFPNLPIICAKAHWYMGWIYADLLKHREKAMEHYQIIVEKYPHVTLTLEPPVPWVSLVLPQMADNPQRVYEHPVYSWRSMALLEMIRNTDDENKKWNAFEKLWADDLNGPATGLALKHLLHGSPALVQRAADRARFYLNARLCSRPMAAEIRQLLSHAHLDFDAAP